MVTRQRIALGAIVAAAFLVACNSLLGIDDRSLDPLYDAGGVEGADTGVPADGGVDGNSPGLLDAGADAAVVTPESLPGLVLWLRADKGVIATDAGVVSTWIDQSALRNDFTAGGVAPSLLADASVGRGIGFVGNQQMVEGKALGLPPGAARTMIVVGRVDSPTAPAGMLFFTNGTNYADWIGLFANSQCASNGMWGAYLSSNNMTADEPTQASTFGVHTLRMHPTTTNDSVLQSLDYRSNSVARTLSLAMGSGAAAAAPAPTRAGIGYWGCGSVAMTVAEVLVYDSFLDDATTLALEQYERTRFGF
jgi:hypothetical protein